MSKVKMKQKYKRSKLSDESPKSTFLDAAAAILERAREPLTAKAITQVAIRMALIGESNRKTPERTMSAALYVDVLNNPASRFKKIAQKGPQRAVRNSVKWTLR